MLHPSCKGCITDLVGAVAVLAPHGDRHASSLSDCFNGYPPPLFQHSPRGAMATQCNTPGIFDLAVVTASDACAPTPYPSCFASHTGNDGSAVLYRLSRPAYLVYVSFMFRLLCCDSIATLWKGQDSNLHTGVELFGVSLCLSIQPPFPTLSGFRGSKFLFLILIRFMDHEPCHTCQPHQSDCIPDVHVSILVLMHHQQTRQYHDTDCEDATNHPCTCFNQSKHSLNDFVSYTFHFISVFIFHTHDSAIGYHLRNPIPRICPAASLMHHPILISPGTL